jgi:arsenate reductase
MARRRPEGDHSRGCGHGYDGAMTDITIFHNPACGTSRNTLALIRHAGFEPVIVEYLKTPLDKGQLRALAGAIGVPVRGLLREKAPPFTELGLDDPKWTDEQLLDFMAQHPILMNRPVVVTPWGAALCRPSERVLALLPVERLPDFTKEDGEVVRDDGQRRNLSS